MAKRLPEIFADMRDAIMGRKKDHSWSESSGAAVNAAYNEIKGFGGETLVKTSERFNNALPYIEKAGFRVIEIEVGLGLSPKVTAHLYMDELLSEQDQSALLVETEDKKLINTVLSSLFKASAARKKLNFRSFHFSMIELELSLLPSVMLKFRPNSEGTNQALIAESEALDTAYQKTVSTEEE